MKTGLYLKTLSLPFGRLRGIVSFSVEKPMPLIKKQGYLKRPQYERILVKLEILRDNGQFNEHEHRCFKVVPMEINLTCSWP